MVPKCNLDPLLFNAVSATGQRDLYRLARPPPSPALTSRRCGPLRLPCGSAVPCIFSGNACATGASVEYERIAVCSKVDLPFGPRRFDGKWRTRESEIPQSKARSSTKHWMPIVNAICRQVDYANSVSANEYHKAVCRKSPYNPIKLSGVWSSLRTLTCGSIIGAGASSDAYRKNEIRP
jgi:hypothetical protein